MALLQHYNEISKYIPNIKTPLPDGQRYIYPIVENKYLYAILIDEEKKEISKVMLCSFVVYKGIESSFLFISDATHEINALTPSVTTDTEYAMVCDSNVWSFSSDELGLFVMATNKEGRYKIYFGNAYSDLALVADSIEKKVVVTETVYV